jgi:hypothetical protein
VERPLHVSLTPARYRRRHTLGHLLVAAIAMWCVAHFHRIARVADLFGS